MDDHAMTKPAATDVSGLAAAINQRLASEALIARAVSFAWLCGGGAVACCLAALGVAAALWGYSYSISVRPATEEIAKALRAAIDHAEFTHTVSGTIELSPTEITLAKSVVKLDPDSHLKLDPNSSIRVIGDVRVDIPQPSADQLQMDRKLGNELPFTTYTIFSDVPFDKGVVETGWTYELSDTMRPKEQFCQYIENLDRDVAARYTLARNGTELAPPEKAAFNFQRALTNCIWFSGI